MIITVLGSGSFGTALGKTAVAMGHQVTLWDQKADLIETINTSHKNDRYLPGVDLPKELLGQADLAKALAEAEMVIFAVPSSAVAQVAQKIKPYLSGRELVVSLAKGVDPKTLAPLSETIKGVLGADPVILSGPSHAEEVARDLPTSMVAASRNEVAMVKVQEALADHTLRIYRNQDLMGVEIGGAVKNIIALAAGISDGVGYGDNTKAALMTRGMAEIIRIGVKMGAEKETFYGLTGMGDLIVTCTSMHSRNRRCGILIGQGMSVEEATKQIGMVVEGIKATKAFHDLAKRHEVEMPITDAIHRVLFEGEDLKAAVDGLMTRDLKRE